MSDHLPFPPFLVKKPGALLGLGLMLVMPTVSWAWNVLPCQIPADPPGRAASPDDVLICDLATGAGAVLYNAPGESPPVFSVDGRYTAYVSAEADLVPEDHNGVADIFVSDLQTGAIQRASLASDGREADAESTAPALSDTANFVAFRSAANNLAEGGSAMARDVFVHELATSTTLTLGIGLGEAPFGRNGFWPVFSVDGRFLAMRRDGWSRLNAESSPPTLAAAASLVPQAAAATDADLDLAFTMTANPEPARVGQPLNYNFKVTNIGPAQATNTVLNINVGNVPVTGLPSECAQTGGVVTCSLGTLPSNTLKQGSIVVQPAAAAALSATATVTAEQTDPNAANNTRTATKTIQAAQANLKVALAVAATPPIPNPLRVGDSLSYQMTVTNQGPSQAHNVVLSFTTPGATANGSLPTGCSSPAPGTLECAYSSLTANGGAVVLTLPVTTTTAGSLLATAQASATEQDPETSDNSASLALTVNPLSADLKVTLSTPAGPVRVGDALSYDFTVENLGPSPASGVKLTVDPGQVTNLTIPQGGGCAKVGAGFECQIGTLNKNGKLSSGFAARAAQAGALTATASVSGQEADPVPANSAATATVQVNPASADLQVSLTASPATVHVGDVVTYQFSINNGGPSISSGAVFVLNLGAVDTSPGIPNGCTLNGNQMRCPLGAHSPNDTPASGQFSVLASAAGPLVATASVERQQADPNLANNTATVTTQVDAPSADLKVTLTAEPNPARVGDVVTYKTMITNAGPSNATHLVVTFAPEGGIPIPVQGCNPKNGGLECQPVDILKGNQIPGLFWTRATVAGPVRTTVRVVAAETDPVPADNSATVATVDAAFPAGDVAITQKASTKKPKVGKKLIFTLTARNKAKGIAANVRAVTMLPEGLGFVSASTRCAYSAQERAVGCAFGGLKKGQSRKAKITVTPLSAGSVTQRVDVGGDLIDSRLSDNVSRLTLTVR